ncbi:MAG: hypothetical protein A2007_03220 [Verrucomicrobia bacterium GWC2_42_7]|nr:MAG: hypothetical protein A2007_03220 [Verrucomicrobia bacterium GWC2_42_7]
MCSNMLRKCIIVNVLICVFAFTSNVFAKYTIEELQRDIAILSRDKLPTPNQIMAIERNLEECSELEKIYPKEIQVLKERLTWVKGYCFPFRIFNDYDSQRLDEIERKKINGFFCELAEIEYDSYELWNRLTWLHGTNSGVLALLPHLGYQLLPTGKLLQKGVAPMSGELTMGGLRTNGVSHNAISGCTIRNIKRNLEYADNSSRTGCDTQPYIDFEKAFDGELAEIIKAGVDHGADYAVLYQKSIPLYRLKQWNYSEWQVCVTKSINKINEFIEFLENNSAPKDTLVILKVLDYDAKLLSSQIQLAQEGDLSGWYQFCNRIGFNLSFQSYQECVKWYSHSVPGLDDAFRYYKSNGINGLLEEIIYVRLLPEARLDPKGHVGNCEDLDIWVSYAEVLEKIRMETLKFQKDAIRYNNELNLRRLFFEPPLVQLSMDGKRLIDVHFPVVFGSTKLIPKNLGTECTLSKGVLGQDIDVMWVPAERIHEVESWKQKGGPVLLNLKIRPLEELRKMSEKSLCEHPSQLIHSALTQPVLNEMNVVLQGVFTQLRTFPSGQNREIHGIAHGARSALISTLLSKLYSAEDENVTSRPGSLEIVTACHDLARDQDGGDDHHLEGKCAAMCKEILKNSSFCNSAELAEIIAQKESENPSIQVETKILHDADSIELFRIPGFNSSAFDYNRLWIVKESKNQAIPFVKELEEFIKITEKPAIKQFIETHPTPYQAVYSIFLALASKKEYSVLKEYLTGVGRGITVELLSNLGL